MYIIIILVQHSADSLGEDDLSEDLERLKASLQAERDDYLSQTAKLLPEERSGTETPL